MSVFRTLANFLLLASALVHVRGFTLVGYPACAAACMAAANQYCIVTMAVGPAGVAACVTAASAGCLTGCLCFDVSTTVNTRAGVQEMLELVPGDEVQTLRSGRPFWTKVKNVHRMEGDFDFVTLWTKSQTLKVTPRHPVFVHESGQSMVRAAGSVSAGDALFLSHGGTEVVDNVTKSHGSAKLIVETDEGTVIASGIFASSMMPNEFLNGSITARGAI